MMPENTANDTAELAVEESTLVQESVENTSSEDPSTISLQQVPNVSGMNTEFLKIGDLEAMNEDQIKLFLVDTYNRIHLFMKETVERVQTHEAIIGKEFPQYTKEYQDSVSANNQ